MDRTLGIIKPNAVKKNLKGKIISMWEEAGFTIVGMKQIRLTRAHAQGFYAEHDGKPFFESLVEFMTSGPVVVVVLEAEDAVVKNRTLMGATDPAKAAAGTIRALYGDSLGENAVHGSDSPTSAAREISHFFSACELM